MLDDYPAVERQVERLKRAHARAEGALAEKLRRLKAVFGCDSEKAGHKRLKELQAEEHAAAESYLTALKAFKAHLAQVDNESQDEGPEEG